MQLKGDYFEVNKSQRHDALLLASTDNRIIVKSVQVTAQTELQNTAINNIEISPRLADTPRTFTFPDGSLFETTQNNEIDQYLKVNKSANSLGWIHTLESKLVYVLLSLALVSLFSWGFIKYGVPGIADVTAKVLPVEVNQYLGKGTLTLLDKSYFAASELSVKRQLELTSKFNRYANEYEELDINVIFRHGGEIGANAFALPDGHIVFTDEMVELAEDDQELIAIFGHEIGHLERRHLLRRVIQDSLLASLVVLITGDISYASSVVIALPVLLLELSYSRNFEEEADRFSLQFLNTHDIPRHYFADIMLRMSQQADKKDKPKEPKGSNVESGFTKYLSTHPVTEERIKPFLN